NLDPTSRDLRGPSEPCSTQPLIGRRCRAVRVQSVFFPHPELLVANSRVPVVVHAAEGLRYFAAPVQPSGHAPSVPVHWKGPAIPLRSFEGCSPFLCAG